MDERIKDLLKDLDQYIQEHWVAPGKEEAGWQQDDTEEQDEESFSKAGSFYDIDLINIALDDYGQAILE